MKKGFLLIDGNAIGFAAASTAKLTVGTQETQARITLKQNQARLRRIEGSGLERYYAIRRSTGAGPARIADDALDVLVHHKWPGNIRELRNVLERIVILAEGADEIRAHHLPSGMRRGESLPEPGEALTLAEVERRHILRILEANGGNRSRSARVLGISRATLYEKLDRYGLRDIAT